MATPTADDCRVRLAIPTGADGFLFRYQPGDLRRHGWHAHAELEFDLVVAGSATYELGGGGRCPLRPGTLVWLHRTEAHRLTGLSEGFAMWVVVIAREAEARLLATADPALRRALGGPAPPPAPARVLAGDDHRALAALLAGLHGLGADPAALAQGLGYALLHAWRCWQRAPGRGGGHPAVERAIAELHRDPTLAADALARRVGLGRTGLSRLFHASTGETILACRSRIRLEAFRRLAGDGRRSLLECALAAGFGSYAQFHRAFVRATGMPPRAWARAAGGGHFRPAGPAPD